MNCARIAAAAALTVAMAAPAFAQATPRHRLQQERMHRPVRYHSAYRYEYRPAYHYTDEDVGVIADTFGGNPFGAPPYPWGAFWIHTH